MDNPVPPALISSVPPAPPVLPPVKNSKNWLKILLAGSGVLIVLGLFGNLYFLARNQKPAAEITTIPTQVVATPTTDPTANWKTYENNYFRAKVPSSYTYEEKPLPTSIDYPASLSHVEFKTEDGFINIVVANNYKKLTVENALGGGPMLSYVKDFLVGKEIQRIVVDGAPAVMVKDIPAGMAGTGIDLIIIRDSNIYQIVLSPLSKSNGGTFDQILSTFKFLDQNQADATADWKTYTDENTHVQFKYPPIWYAQKYADSTFSVFLEDKPFQIIKGTEFMTSIHIRLNELQNTVTGQKFYMEKTLGEGVERLKGLFDAKTVQITELTIDGKKATRLSGLLGPGMLEGEYFVDTLIQLDDKLLVATLTKKSYEDVYNQILSTFRLD